jgi:signal transduction histidine kinase
VLLAQRQCRKSIRDVARFRRRSTVSDVLRMLQATVQQLAQHLLSLFSCRRILVAAREHESGRALLWTAQGSDRNFTPIVQTSTLSRSRREGFFAPAPACWHALRRGGSTGTDQFEIMYLGRLGTTPEWCRFVPRSWKVLDRPSACLAAAFEFGSEWTCRLFVVDPKLNRPRRNILRLAQGLVAALSPALYNLYIAEQRRTIAAETERANLARALHDEVIQSLIAAEMEVHTACLRSTKGSVVGAAELGRIQDILHDEVLGLRDLMQRIKPVQIQPEELCDTLAECVAKFKADTGIAASFFASVQHVSLPPAMCPPIVRLVQEALANVRKHSGARCVAVTIDETNGHWRLLIEDDGRGIDWNGDTFTPLVIRDCVRAVDGELKVMAAASGGLRLEIAFTGYSTCTEPPASNAKLVAVKEMARVPFRASGSRHRVGIPARAESVLDVGSGDRVRLAVGPGLVTVAAAADAGPRPGAQGMSDENAG